MKKVSLTGIRLKRREADLFANQGITGFFRTLGSRLRNRMPADIGRRGAGVICGCISIVFFGISSEAAQTTGTPQISLIPVLTGLDRPVHINHAGDGSSRLFVVEQTGKIRILKDGKLLTAPFLDITGRVSCCGERGLLSVAFPPGYGEKNYFYIDYTDIAGNTVVARHYVTSNPDIADSAREDIILTVDQPFPNHNGGQLAFGPDGYLYIGMGDGGSGGDPFNNAQNVSSLLGKLLRIDVESSVVPYSVPPSNPFAQSPGHRGEIWALGLRNPWRFSFDSLTGDLYIGDVGQGSFEEINVQDAASAGGENYGWNVMEGLHCYVGTICNQSGLTRPVYEYNHVQGDCSVTGGLVYRGNIYPRIYGIYFFSDYCSGRIWGLRKEGPTWHNSLLFDSPYQVTSFGEDEGGNLYVTDYSGGAIYKITDALAFMPLPEGQHAFAVPLSVFPWTDPDPAAANPMGEGFLSLGILSLRVGLTEFSGPVDVYFGIYAPSIEPDVYILKEDTTLQKISDGLLPWKPATTGPVNEPLFGTISVSALPPGVYTLYVAVTPAGNTASYYLWSTSFTIF